MPTASALQVLAPVGLGFCIHLDFVESGLGPTHGTFPFHPAWHHPTEREGRTLCDSVSPYTQGTVRASPYGRRPAYPHDQGVINARCRKPALRRRGRRASAPEPFPPF